jgi:hypothetical protein
LIFAKRHSQHPMKLIFYTPLQANSRKQLLCRPCPTTDEVAGFFCNRRTTPMCRSLSMVMILLRFLHSEWRSLSQSMSALSRPRLTSMRPCPLSWVSAIVILARDEAVGCSKCRRTSSCRRLRLPWSARR